VALRKLKPTSAGQRFVVRVVKEGIHQGAPYEPLLEPFRKRGGRNNNGRITTRHQGGGHKRNYRVIDFKRDKDGVPGKVERLEYDPNRTSYLALVLYTDGERRYILAPKRVQPGDPIMSGTDAPIKPGNALPLKNIPIGSLVHCLEMKPGKGGQMARSAGTFVQLIGKDRGLAQLRMASGEQRTVSAECMATVGAVSNPDNSNQQVGKAGRMRWMGFRPHNRGVVMNPVDHPLGGGEGRSSGGRHPVTPWGKPTKGYKTRTNKRTDSLIIRRRNKGK